MLHNILSFDPTYLRYIVDGLENQSLHRDGIASLPDGLIGIYEDAIPNDRQFGLREKFLDFFAIWALLKKEVSVSFILPLLHWEAQVAIDFLSEHTKWFNSPSSGKYLLCHDRLRVYLLERIPSHKLDKTNRKIIAACQSALQQPSGNEWEQYALEHLPSHLLIPAMQHETDGAAFKQLVNDTAFWNRQLEVSKGYDWTKKMLNQLMAWAAKQNTDELIGFALNKVDLHYMEQNDAPRIVELVAQNDLDTALQRIEAFGGNDKEGIQRKFTLYMLCLMELTLLGSKDKPFRRSAIERLLNHLDEHLPTDHSILSWNDFFPSYLMFQMACEWAEMGLDYKSIYKRTNPKITRNSESDWITVKGPYTDLHFEVMLKFADCIIDERDKISVLILISSEMFKQSSKLSANLLLEEVLLYAREIKNVYIKNSALLELCKHLSNHDNEEVALQCAREINDLFLIGKALNDISEKQYNNGKTEKAFILINEVFELYRKTKDESERGELLILLSNALAKQGKTDEALALVRSSNLINHKRIALAEISTVIHLQGKLKEVESTMQEALTYTKMVITEEDKDKFLGIISKEFAKQKNIKQAISYAKKIVNNRIRNSTIKSISIKLAEESTKEDLINVVNLIDRGFYRQTILSDICAVMTKNGKLQQALAIAREMDDNYWKSLALIQILIHTKDSETQLKSSELISEAYNLISSIEDGWKKNAVLKNLLIEAAKKEQINSIYIFLKKGLSYNLSDITDFMKSNLTLDIFVDRFGKESIELSTMINNAYLCVNFINSDIWKCKVLNSISSELNRRSFSQEALKIINDSLAYARRIKDNDYGKSRILQDISFELTQFNKHDEASTILKEAFSIILGMNTPYSYRPTKLFLIEFVKKGRVNQGIEFAQHIKNTSLKNTVLSEMCLELVNQNSHIEALNLARNISSESKKCQYLAFISIELLRIGSYEESVKIKNEAIECSRGISDIKEKAIALVYIYSNLIKLGNAEEASNSIKEALELSKQFKSSVEKFRFLRILSLEMAKLGRVENSIYFAKFIKTRSEKEMTYSDLLCEFAKQDKWKILEITCYETLEIAARHRVWQEIASLMVSQHGFQKAAYITHKLQSKEASLFYLKGLVEHLNTNDVNHSLIKEIIPFLVEDSSSIEILLQKYAIAQVALGNLSQQLVECINKSLNIQWAIDIRDILHQQYANGNSYN
jgi:tetratricopeptide (TPR) repeat protein